MHLRGDIVGFSFGLPGYGSQSNVQLTTVGINATHVSAGRLGYDLSVGTAPRTFADGVVAIGARAGVVAGVPITNQIMVLPGVGASLIGLTNGDDGIYRFGWNMNISMLAALSRTTISGFAATLSKPCSRPGMAMAPCAMSRRLRTSRAPSPYRGPLFSLHEAAVWRAFDETVCRARG